MAYAHVALTHESTLVARFNAGMHSALETLKNRRRVSATIRSLSALDTPTLNDLGIDRSGIRAAANAAVYGA